MAEATAHGEALKLLARRELSVAGVRARLADRGFPPDEIEDALTRLTSSGALDDGRVARAYARTAAGVKGRGRLRVMRELHGMGIDPEIVAQVLGEIFAELDERTLIARAIEKKLRGRAAPRDPGGVARLYQYLMRQGFSHAACLAALRRFPRGAGPDQE